MYANKTLGWLSLILLGSALAVLLLIALLLLFFPTALPVVADNVQVFILVSGLLALGAAVLGYFSRRTAPGRIGFTGGLLLFLAIALFLSFTVIARVEVKPTAAL